MTWIQTYTNKAFDYESFDPDAVCIEDIAHALSQLCRFTGHTRKFYSVAEHCFRVSRAVLPGFALEGLMHDASEAYLMDVAAPLKHMSWMEGYRECERRWERVIAKKYGLVFPWPESVKTADMRMLMTEARDLLGPSPRPWCQPFEPYETKICPMTPTEAEESFLLRFLSLTRI